MTIFHAVPILGQSITIRVDIAIDIQLPTPILLPSELAVHNNGDATFWLTGFNQSIPPAILAWPRGRPRHHPHYSVLIQEVSDAT